MTYIAATLNPEILKNFPGPVRVGKKKSGSGRVAGTRQGLLTKQNNFCDGEQIPWARPAAICKPPGSTIALVEVAIHMQVENSRILLF